jgi:hypothetical protein
MTTDFVAEMSQMRAFLRKTGRISLMTSEVAFVGMASRIMSLPLAASVLLGEHFA